MAAETIYSDSTSPGVLSMTLAAVCLAMIASGCGGGGSSTTPAVTRTRTATTPAARTAVPSTTTASPPAGTVTSGSPATVPPTNTNGEGDHGDEEAIRVPATFTFRAGRLSPRTVSVPSFLNVQITVLSADGRAHRVLVRTPHGVRTLKVPAGGRAGVLLGGRKRGGYRLVADGGAARAAVVFGAQPGP